MTNNELVEIYTKIKEDNLPVKMWLELDENLKLPIRNYCDFHLCDFLLLSNPTIGPKFIYKQTEDSQVILLNYENDYGIFEIVYYNNGSSEITGVYQGSDMDHLPIKSADIQSLLSLIGRLNSVIESRIDGAGHV